MTPLPRKTGNAETDPVRQRTTRTGDAVEVQMLGRTSGEPAVFDDHAFKV